MSLHRPLRLLVVLAASAFLWTCGSSSTPALNTITISNYTYSPSNLSVQPGTTVTVINADGTDHSVTSQTALSTYAPGAVDNVQFDTGPFVGRTTFTISSTAQAGTVIPYYCSVHKGTMGMGQGQITIVAP
ncbi:MAG: plastocyanin/azurin family copper-binding protein [Myxococcaceae bacterium]